MYQALWADSTFHQFLFAIDEDLAAKARAAGCPRCGARLHSATFPRKPRGVPEEAKPFYERRFSFTCKRCESNRQQHRMTPASARFLGRKVYVAMVVTLMSAMRDGVTDRRFDRLAEILRVDRRTVGRWRGWWREAFPALPFWRAKSADFVPPLDSERLPLALLANFGDDARKGLLAFLRYLEPITGGASAQAF